MEENNFADSSGTYEVRTGTVRLAMQTKEQVHSDKKIKKKIKDILIITFMGIFIVPVAVIMMFYSNGIEDEF